MLHLCAQIALGRVKCPTDGKSLLIKILAAQFRAKLQPTLLRVHRLLKGALFKDSGHPGGRLIPDHIIWPATAAGGVRQAMKALPRPIVPLMVLNADVAGSQRLPLASSVHC